MGAGGLSSSSSSSLAAAATVAAGGGGGQAGGGGGGGGGTAAGSTANVSVSRPNTSSSQVRVMGGECFVVNVTGFWNSFEAVLE